MTQLSSEKLEFFKGRHFNHLLTIQAMRWYVTYKLSYRDVCDLMTERGVTLVHTTVLGRSWNRLGLSSLEKLRQNRMSASQAGFVAKIESLTRIQERALIR
jgi:transposase-like protein